MSYDFKIYISAIRTSISDDWSSTGFMEAAAELEGPLGVDKEKIRLKREKEKEKERQKVEKEKENEDETVKVYDGYAALRKRIFRTITIHKMCSKDELLLAAMKAYVVSQDSRNFYLLDVYGDGDREEEIEDPTPVLVSNYCNNYLHFFWLRNYCLYSVLMLLL